MRGIKVVILLAVFLSVFLTLTGLVFAADSSCSQDQIIMKLSGSVNAHGALYNNTRYTADICYKNIFGTRFTGNTAPHNCNSSLNTVLLFAQEGVAHTYTYSGMPIIEGTYSRVCYGDLKCTARTGDCLPKERPVISMSSQLNAHLSLSEWNYPIKICCSSQNASLTLCENGRIDPGETCDSKAQNVFNSLTCINFDEFTNGDLNCNENCQINTSACTCNGAICPIGVCGDEVVNLGETCDTNNLSDLECEDFGFNGGGYLSCENCQINTTKCIKIYEPICGDSEIDPGETCDFLTINGEQEMILPFTDCLSHVDKCTEGSVFCNAVGTANQFKLNSSECSQCIPYSSAVCGNNRVDALGEMCDGTDLKGLTCDDFELVGNGLKCYSPGTPNQCTFDTTACKRRCAEGQTLCLDTNGVSSCKDPDDCTNFRCNNNRICEKKEGCQCADCHGFRDGCENGLVCDFETDSCHLCKSGIFTPNSFLGTCEPFNGISITIKKPQPGAKYVVNKNIEFEQESSSPRKDLTINWSFGDGQSKSIKNCLTTGNCDTIHKYISIGHFIIQALAYEQGGFLKDSDYSDVFIYRP